MSRIVTFYSYKGGVGRTLALANIGILLARRGQRVLLMDWDLEAPGLDRYFRPYQHEVPSPERGVAQLLCQAVRDPDADWRAHVQEISVKPRDDKAACAISFIPSGVAAPDYAEQVRGFSWSDFLAERGGGAILERWRSEWKEAFDFILIDSRTGITDAGGICTILLPDFLVLVLTANEQSYEGTLAIAASAQVERRKLSVQRPPLMILPILSRFDRRDEIEESEKWLRRFAAGLKPMYADWLPKQYDPMQILEVTKVPYVTRFSFGEPLPVLTHSLTDPELPGFYLENCARLLATDFREAARIIDPKAPEPQDISDQIRSLIQRAPIDEQELNRLLRVAELELGEGAQLASLLSSSGTALHEQARFPGAEPMLRRALAMDERLMGADHPIVSRDLNNVAMLLKDMNRFAEAESLIRRALAIDEQSVGADDLRLATRLSSLARILQATGRCDEAESLARRALAIAERSLGCEHPDIAAHLNTLATLLMQVGRRDSVESLLRRALAIVEGAYGPDHPIVAAGLSNLAAFLHGTERLAEAEPLSRRALAIEEQNWGAGHPNVAISLNNLAQILTATERVGEAESLMRRALEIDEKSFGADHPSVARDLNNLADLVRHTDRLVEAEDLMHRALVVILKSGRSNGYDHPRLKRVLDNYRDVLQTMSYSEETMAERLTRAASEAGYDKSTFAVLLKELEQSEIRAQSGHRVSGNPDLASDLVRDLIVSRQVLGASIQPLVSESRPGG